MPVGDVTSPERGTAARYNDGKPDFSLVPMDSLSAILAYQGLPSDVVVCLACLGRFQATRERKYLLQAINALGPEMLVAGVKVLEYGTKKYAAWNWAKGFAWSIPVGCIGRHAFKMAKGEENDDESGLPHAGHIVANLLMLLHFDLYYRVGDDLAPVSVFQPLDRSA